MGLDSLRKRVAALERAEQSDSAPTAQKSAESKTRAFGKSGNKYHARRVPCDQGGTAHVHDSAKERQRCFVLHQRQALGEIRRLELHPRYRLEVNGVLIGHYTGDAAYQERTPVALAGMDRTIMVWESVVEDTKSAPTRKRADYQLRRRLMRALHGIDIRET